MLTFWNPFEILYAVDLYYCMYWFEVLTVKIDLCSSVLIACYICLFHNHCIIAPINVKIWWHVLNIIFDLW